MIQKMKVEEWLSVGDEVFTMKAELDPKFLRNFSTDYKYNELNDEQKEVHDALFHADEEYDLEEDLPENEEENELDMIISMAKGEQKREVK